MALLVSEEILNQILKAGFKAQSFLVLGGSKGRKKVEDIFIKFLRPRPEDFYVYEEPLLKIEKAQEIHAAASRTAFGEVKLFLVKSAAIAPDTQSALLKTIEEPPSQNYFIFSGLNEGAASAPLLSRLVVLKTPLLESEEEILIQKKLKGGIKKEMEAAAFFAGERDQAEKFLRALEFWTKGKIAETSGPDLKKIAGFLEELLLVKVKFYAKTYFNRMLLEHLIISKSYLSEI